MGIRIMQHRAELMGGTLSVEPAPESGTDVIVRIDMRGTCRGSDTLI
jgi:signal transduction histidine kinase